MEHAEPSLNIHDETNVKKQFHQEIAVDYLMIYIKVNP